MTPMSILSGFSWDSYWRLWCRDFISFINYMTIELDEKELTELIQQMTEWGGDESGFYHVANYILGEIYKQYPELKKIADKRFE